MKRVITIVLILAGAFTLTGCEKTTYPPGESPKEQRRERLDQAYKFCIENGGSFSVDNWSGEAECENASGKNNVNIEVDN